MESFHWDKNFITGLPIVDEQHHYLVDIFNQFSDHLSKDELVFSDIKDLFKELFDYADYHFREEEKMMAEFEIDKRHLDHHVEAHRYFLNEITTMHSSISPENVHTTQEMLDFLTRWLAYHILGSDQNMARQIKAIQRGVSPVDAYNAEERRSIESTEPLVVALTGLFEQVTIRNRRLAQLNETLEQKVAERTKALADANIYLEKLSKTDHLTGLPNRRYGTQKLSDAWDDSLENNTQLTCIMIDADHFKEVNDKCGHDFGDVVLRALADTIRKAVRSTDTVYRLGGDEFFVICPDTAKEEGMRIAETVRNAVSTLRVKTCEGDWCGSVSVGVATRSLRMKDYEGLIKAADMSVYESKRAGKNCVSAVNLSS